VLFMLNCGGLGGFKWYSCELRFFWVSLVEGGSSPLRIIGRKIGMSRAFMDIGGYWKCCIVGRNLGTGRGMWGIC